jgi:hypothetical protein
LLRGELLIESRRKEGGKDLKSSEFEIV